MFWKTNALIIKTLITWKITKDQETPYEYEVKTPLPTDLPNTPSQNRDYVNSTPEE